MNQSTSPVKYNKLNTTILLLTPILTAVFVPLHWVYYGYSWMDWMWFGIFMICAGIGITGGYHRLWSHKAYDANSLVKMFYAYWGACAAQNSIIKWSSDHRIHHKHVDDNDKDPYSAKKGFWWSHMGWILKQRETDFLARA